jgi:hypothetical protein
MATSQDRQRFAIRSKKASTANKQRSSTWFITINPLLPRSTWKSKGITEEDIQRKLTLCAKLFEQPMLSKFVYFASRDDPKHTFDTHVDRTTFEFELEEGTSRAVLWHMHGLLQVNHRSNTRLSYVVIKKALEKIFGHTVWFHAVIVKNGGGLGSIRDYMRKNKSAIQKNVLPQNSTSSAEQQNNEMKKQK